MTMTQGQGTMRVQEFLNQYDIPLELATYSKSTRTAEDAARAIGCHVDEIVKSLVVTTTHTHTPILILASGVNQVDLAKSAQQLAEIDSNFSDETLQMADAKFVKEITGFAVGGVAPVGHKELMITLIDADLMDKNTLWAAAGDPRTVFNISPDNLLHITQGHVVDIG